MTTTPDNTSSLTVLLVHGAFADSAGWNGVLAQLHDRGVTAWAVSNPLRGIAHDAAYVSSIMQQTEGPVLAVGHSYGGAVITNAALQAGNVIGLVYVAAFAPDEGESLGQIEEGSKDSVLNTALREWTYPSESGGKDVEFFIDPAQFFDAFANDLPLEETRLMAATQRPVAALAFSEPTRNPAWRQLPSWAVVPTGDKAAGSDVVRSMAQRASASITEVDGSHVIMISQPQAVAEVIMTAVESLTGR